MKINAKKIATIAVPLAIGGGILAFFGTLSGPRSSGAPATANASVGTVAPQDTIHEQASLNQQLKQNPGHPPILLRLSELARDQGKHAEAIDYLRQALETEPTNADARLELGRALYEAGDIEGAIRETKQLVEDHPDNVDGLYNLGAIYANQGQPDLARDYWTKATAVDALSDSGLKAKNGLQQIGGNAMSLPAGFLEAR